jgi:two-component system sensor histidine kinase and response regulator WspE
MDHLDPAMLELFQQEAAANSRTLLDGLEPDASAPAEDLVRAAHSIRGAARIVGLGPFADLAGSMENLLAGGVPGGGARDVLVRAAELFASLGAADGESLPELAQSNQEQAEQLARELDQPPPPAETEQAAEPAGESPEASGEETEAGEAPAVDESMLELFRSEAEENARTLQDGLAALKEEQASADSVEPLARAAHSIRGAARIVGLDAAGDLARAMEDVLSEAQQDPGALAGERLDRLARGAELFAQMGACGVAELSGMLHNTAGELQEAADALREASEAAPKSGEFEPRTEAAPSQAPKETPKPAAESQPAVDPEMDASMLELFRVEAETNAQVLSTGLVELEEAGVSAERVEPLMRSAHSIKGAARIVGLPKTVELAHAMEDVLSAAQQGRRGLSGDDVDLLLQGTDVLSQLSAASAGDLPGLVQDMAPRMDQLAHALRSGEPLPPPAAEESAAQASDQQAAPEATAEDQAQAGKQGPAESDGVVRLSARNLSQIMALSGETLVEAGRLAPFTNSLLQIKNGQRDMARDLETLREMLDNQDVEGAVKHLEQASQRLAQCRRTLAEHMESFDLFARRSDNLHNRLHNRILASRMRPFQDGVHGFPRLIRDISRSLGKKAVLRIKGQETMVDRDVLDRLEAPLNHLLRNAVDHGLETPEERKQAGKDETGTISLEARHSAGMLAVTVADDGRGMDPERIRRKVIDRGLAPEDMALQMNRAELMEFLFLPGFTTTDQVTEISGRGVGLDVVHAMIQEVGGNVRAESQPGQGMTFSMQMPLTLSVMRTLLVEVAGQPYALQLTRLDRILNLPFDEVRQVEDKQYFVLENSNIGLAHAGQILEQPVNKPEGEHYCIVVISDRMNRYGLAVDRFLGERDLVVRPVDGRLGKVRDVYAAARLPDGSPCFILDVEDLVRSVDDLLQGKRLAKLGAEGAEAAARAKNVLVVDDSLTVREVERKLLENAGFTVETAVNGMDGLNAARLGSFDLIVTDVDMPRMNGIDLVRKVKADPQLAGIPIMIVSYKDREEDRLAGLDAGADYYLTKGSFHDETLLQAVYDLIGEP